MPSAQVSQEELPTALNSPPLQMAQLVEPELPLYFPAKHEVHVDEPLATACSPGLHSVQLTLFGDGLYLPLSQVTQVAAPVAENSPASQSEHATASLTGLLVPASHSVHESLPSSALNFPIGHFLQRPWAKLSWYQPAGQGVQALRPKLAPNFPIGHSLQVLFSPSSWK